MGVRDVELFQDKALAKARAEIAAQSAPRREYVRVLRGFTELLYVSFNANTDEESSAAARVKAALQANEGSRAVVSHRCHGALAEYPAVFDLNPTAPPEPPVVLTEEQEQVLRQLAEAKGWAMLEYPRIGASLRHKGLASRKDGRYKISKKGLAWLKGGK